MRKKKYPNSLVEKGIEMMKNGMNARSAAKEISIPYNTFLYRAHKAGVERQPTPPPMLPDSVIEKGIEMVNAGMTARDAAKEIGMTYQAFHRRAKKLVGELKESKWRVREGYCIHCRKKVPLVRTSGKAPKEKTRRMTFDLPMSIVDALISEWARRKKKDPATSQIQIVCEILRQGLEKK